MSCITQTSKITTLARKQLTKSINSTDGHASFSEKKKEGTTKVGLVGLLCNYGPAIEEMTYLQMLEHM